MLQSVVLLQACAGAGAGASLEAGLSSRGRGRRGRGCRGRSLLQGLGWSWCLFGGWLEAALIPRSLLVAPLSLCPAATYIGNLAWPMYLPRGSKSPVIAHLNSLKLTFTVL